MTDNELLARYAEKHDQEAFTELARRQSPWVYSCARRILRDPTPADDVTQAVFILLATKSPSLRGRAQLAGWLFRAIQYCARAEIRSHARRQQHEREAAMQRRTNTPADANWEEISPVLDAAVAELSTKDREAILLRFYQGMSVSELAASVGTGEEAAKKRVQRAVEKLRRMLARKGVSAGATGLALLMTQNVIEAAPTGVVDGAMAAASAGSASTTAGTIAKGAATMMAWAKVKLAAVGVAMLAVVAVVGGEIIGPREDSPATKPADPVAAIDQPLDVGGLVAEVRAAEAWIDEVSTFHVRIEYTENRPPAMLKQRVAEWQKLLPNTEITQDHMAGLLPVEKFRSEIAFAAGIAFYHRTSLDEGSFQIRKWDGAQLTQQYKTTRTSKATAPLSSKVEPPREGILYDLSFFRAGPHRFWKSVQTEPGEFDDGLLEDFRLTGRETYRGVECYVLTNVTAYQRWYVGTQDHRLYSVKAYGSTRQRASEAALQALVQKRSGRSMNIEEIMVWQDKLASEERVAFAREVAEATFKFASVVCEWWMSDYREVTPGRFFPMEQGVRFFPDDQELFFYREGRIVDVTIDQPLPARILQGGFQKAD